MGYLYLYLLPRPPIAERGIVMTISVCVCLSVRARISPKLHVRSSPTFCARHHGRGSVLLCMAASRYVMYFRFVDGVIAAHQPRQLNVAAQLMEAQHTCSLGLGYKRRVGIPAAGQWTHTHGPTFRAPRSGLLNRSGRVEYSWHQVCT